LWYNGIFGFANLSENTKEAIWHNGTFYGGIFVGDKWEGGAFYTNNETKSYWLPVREDDDPIWERGYIDNVFSSASPIQILENNKTF
jgi:hypothetical protein